MKWYILFPCLFENETVTKGRGEYKYFENNYSLNVLQMYECFREDCLKEWSDCLEYVPLNIRTSWMKKTTSTINIEVWFDSSEM